MENEMSSRREETGQRLHESISDENATNDSLLNCAISKKRKLELNRNSNYANDSLAKRASISSDENSSDGNVFSSVNVKPSRLQEWLHMFHNWSHCERLVALDSLVTSEICDIQQIRYLLSLIEPQLQRDFISLLPKELSLYVLAFLEPKDLLKAAQTCRYWRILCEDNLLWREKCAEEGLLDDNETIADLFRKRLNRTPVSPLPSPSTSSSVNSTFVRSEYKLAYLRQKSIEFNWRYGRFPNDSDTTSSTSKKSRFMNEILHLKGHDDHVITCLQFNPTSNLIVSGSDDNTLKVWSSITGRCLRTLTGHTGGVWSSQLSPNNIVISGSTDRTLKVWDALTGECLHTLYGHTSTVRCMALHGNNVVSGSRDATLRVWNISTGECCHVLVGHVAAVRCVQFNGKIVVSGAYDYLVKVWEVSTESCLHTLEGHTNRVYSLQFDGENIVSGSLDTSIRVWSAASGVLKHTLIGHQSLTSGMQLRGPILVSGNADSTVKVWDINSGQCLQTLAGPNKHQSAVTCLQFNSRFVITSSDDGTVKLWDLRTGEFIRNLVCLSSGGSGGVVWRIRASNTKLVCAVGSRNGTEETKLLVLDFDPEEDYMESSMTSRCDY
ncbi:F-box/WD repeat-containing protein 7-like isoform X1 [Leptotrombidium deliense]|uniref:F-box/WD repeat-containing protein 7-like isoform X1 n=1 Tax=Leptotrombidium deliense TaxID=299467 RepID=A0A443SLW0_9ACAR|nr:F-box/WD repeat-containing protein 7-like isoform X1 [Leptotrombidium deliense]